MNCLRLDRRIGLLIVRLMHVLGSGLDLYKFSFCRVFCCFHLELGERGLDMLRLLASSYAFMVFV